jgi:hypothetical protein
VLVGGSAQVAADMRGCSVDVDQDAGSAYPSDLSAAGGGRRLAYMPMSDTPRLSAADLAGCWFAIPAPLLDSMCAVSRAGGGQRQAWRRGTERDYVLVAAREAGRAVAWSRQLAQAHAAVRQQLRGLRASLGSAQAGGLVTHCLAFCSTLSAHHHGEDAGLLAELLRVRPDPSGHRAKAG